MSDQLPDGHVAEVPIQHDASSTPSEPSGRRRKPLLIGIVIGALVTFAVLAVIGFLAAPSGSGILFEEDFSSNEPVFTTDSDRLVDQSVVDGEYRILIRDASAPQIVRHVFAHTHDGLRFEASVTLPGPTEVAFSVGCWNGDSSYLFVLLGSGEVGLIETVSESRAERRSLTDVIATDAVRPAGEPNRLRIDCVGGGREPTLVSGWVNGEPVISVAVPQGYDSFNAVGFFLGSETDGVEFLVDDVVAAGERPAPATSPVSPMEP